MMLKTTYVLILFLCISPFADGTAKKFQFNLVEPVPEPTSFNHPANVDSLELDRTELVLPCVKENTADLFPVKIKMKASDPENDTLVYDYWVTGGLIKGQGSEVIWDLSGMKPGTYKLLAGADDGMGIVGRKMIRQVIIRQSSECAREASVQCPDIKISPPEQIVINRVPAFVTVNMDRSPVGSSFNWKISDGQIISGQGLSLMTIDLSKTYGDTLALFVEASNVPEGCPTADVVVVDMDKSKLSKPRPRSRN